jgi:hypothetical protein
MDGADSGSCPMAGFGISEVNPLGWLIQLVVTNVAVAVFVLTLSIPMNCTFF